MVARSPCAPAGPRSRWAPREATHGSEDDEDERTEGAEAGFGGKSLHTAHHLPRQWAGREARIPEAAAAIREAAIDNPAW